MKSNEDMDQFKQEVLRIYKKSGSKAPRTEDVIGHGRGRVFLRRMLDELCEEGKLRWLDKDHYIYEEDYDKAKRNVFGK